MSKIKIFYSEELGNQGTSIVGFNIHNASSDDFSAFVKCAKLLRQASDGKMVYDHEMKSNIVESTVPKKTALFIKDRFENKFRDKFSDDLEIVLEKQEIEDFDPDDIANIQQEVDFSPIEKHIELLEDLYLDETYKLKKHQKEGLFFTVDNEKAYLAFEPGTGKTLIYFTTILYLYKYRNIKNFLVIGPAAYGATRNIYEEFKQYMNDESRRIINLEIFDGNKNKKQREFLENVNDINILIVSYETIRLKNVENVLEIGEEIGGFDFVACDEAKALMNGSSKQSKNIRNVIETFDIGFIQLGEGTPIRGFADDLWNPLDLITDGQFSNYYVFRNKYCIMDDITIGGGRTIKVVKGSQNGLELHNKLKKVMLTKKLDDLGDVPSLVFSKLFVEIKNKDHKRYLKQIQEDFEDWYYEYKKSHGQKARKMQDTDGTKLTQVLRLYQGTTTPNVLDEDIYAVDLMNTLVEYTDEAILSNDKKVVIFTKFRQTAFNVEEEMKELINNNKEYKGFEIINYINYSGDQKIEQVKRFQGNDNVKIFITTIDGGGASITLNSASDVIFVEKPFTYAELFQALRRVQRIGQKNKVKVMSLVTKDTISEKIEKKIFNKKQAADIVMDGKVDEIIEDVSFNLEDFLIGKDD